MAIAGRFVVTLSLHGRYRHDAFDMGWHTDTHNVPQTASPGSLIRLLNVFDTLNSYVSLNIAVKWVGTGKAAGSRTIGP